MLRKLALLSLFLAYCPLAAHAGPVSATCGMAMFGQQQVFGQQVDFAGSQGEELGVACSITVLPKDILGYSAPVYVWTAMLTMVSTPDPSDSASVLFSGDGGTVEPCGATVTDCSGYLTLEQLPLIPGDSTALLFDTLSTDGGYEFVNADGIEVKLMDAPSDPAPEPASLLLFSTGLVGLWFVGSMRSQIHQKRFTRRMSVS